MKVELLLCLIGCSIGLFLMTDAVVAQDPITAEIKPTAMILAISRTQESEQILKVANHSQIDLSFDLTVSDIEPVPNSAIAVSAWTTLLPASFSLAGGESQIVIMNIKVPFEADLGSHFAKVEAMITPVPDPDNHELTYYTGNNLTTQLVIKVPGVVEEKLTLGNFRIEQRIGKVQFVFDLTNAGNVHLLPKGNITISGGLLTHNIGPQNYLIPVTTELIIPNHTATITVPWEDAVSYGTYAAELNLYYGEAHQQVRETINFTRVDQQWIVYGGVVLVLIVLFSWWIAKRLHRAPYTNHEKTPV